MSKRKEIFMLPDQSTTTSSKKYIAAWRELGKKIGDVINCHAIGFDPDFSFISRQNGKQHDMPLSWAIAFAKVLDEAKANAAKVTRLEAEFDGSYL